MENSRFLIKFDQALKKINREQINPILPPLNMEQLDPVIGLVARARAAYLKDLFALANAVTEGLPARDQTESLRQHRKIYEELVAGVKALETAMERGYLEVQDGDE